METIIGIEWCFREACLDESAIGDLKEGEEDCFPKIHEKVQSGISRFQTVRVLGPFTNQTLEQPLTC
jgi:hypothetical protein